MVAYKSYFEKNGILKNWSLRRGSRNRRLDCSKYSCGISLNLTENSENFLLQRMTEPPKETEALETRMASYRSNPVPLPDLHFDSFSYPVAPIVSSAEGIV